MYKGRYFALAGILCSAALGGIAACESSGETGATGAGGSTTAGAGGAAAVKTTELRVAQLSPSIEAVDFCLRREGDATFNGPYLSAQLNEPAGLLYGKVTKYVIIPEGTYTVRFVPAGQAKCDPALNGAVDVASLKLETGKRYTAAAMGQIAPQDPNVQPFSVKLYADRTSIAAGKVSLTFIHASPDAPKVDVGLGTGADFKPIFTDVAFGEKGQAEGKSYFEADPMEANILTIRPSGTTTDVLMIQGFALPAGTIATTYAIGDVSGAPKPLAGLVCFDSDKPEGNFTKCTMTP